MVGEIGFVGLRDRLKQLGGELEIRTRGSVSMVTAVVRLKPSRMSLKDRYVTDAGKA